jgi:hypothetical protein
VKTIQTSGMPVSQITDQQPPIADLEHPFAMIAKDIAEGCSKSAIGGCRLLISEKDARA